MEIDAGAWALLYDRFTAKIVKTSITEFLTAKIEKVDFGRTETISFGELAGEIHGLSRLTPVLKKPIFHWHSFYVQRSPSHDPQ